MKRPALVLAMVLLTVGGCQCFTPTQDCNGLACPRPSAGTTQDLLDQILIAAVCDQERVCGTAAPTASCDDLMWGNRYSTGDGAQLDALAAAGTLDLNLDAGFACLAAYRTTCDPGCWPPWKGTLGNGHACQSSYECQPGLGCFMDTSCPGHCAPKLDAGVDTDDMYRCGTSAFALLDDGGARCLDAVPVGGSCASATDERGQNRICVRGAVCAGDLSGGKECARPLVLGQLCPYGGCGTGLWCRGQQPVCVKSAGQGDACDRDTEGTLLPPCLDGLACNNGTCGLPRGTLGSTCQRFGDDCVFPFRCNWQGTCQKVGSIGDVCSGAFDCGDFRDECIGGSCQPAVQRGGICTMNGDCAHDLVCDQGKCARWACGG